MNELGTSQAQQARTVGKAVRALPALVAAAMALLALAPFASADKTIGSPGEGAGQTKNPQGLATDFETGDLYVADQGNNRIDAFDSAGSFLMAFGWGVADGKAELQSCGPAATPPTATCRKGLAGGGAGEFDQLGDIAIDNDPASSSHHDVYVLDQSENLRREGTGFEGRGYRVQKFDPEGHFLLTWGGGTITGGASGTANLTAGSSEVTNVQTTAKVFEAGQTIESPGKIPAGTKILDVGAGTITLSKPAIAAGLAAPLDVAAGPGNKPTNEIVTLLNKAAPPTVYFTTPNPSPSEAEFGPPSLSVDPTAAELQSRLEALPNVGAGNVEVADGGVSGGAHKYTIEFKGPRFADTNVFLQGGLGLGEREFHTVQNGGGAAEICTAAIAASCSGGIEGTGHGQFARFAHLAVGPTGTVYVVDCIQLGGIFQGGTRCENRLQKFEPPGAFVEELALPQTQLSLAGVVADSSGDFYVSDNRAIRRYDPAGGVAGQLAVGSEAGAIVVDASGDVFAAEGGDGGPVVAEFDSAGNTLRRFGYGVVKKAASLALYEGPGGGLYTAEGDSVLLRSLPAPGPIVVPRPCETSFLGNSKATLFAEVNPEGKATTTHFQYISDADFSANGNSFSGPKPATTTAESTSIGVDFFLHEAEAQAELVPETKYHCRVIATNADAPGGIAGPEGTFTSKAPLEIGSTTVSGVGTEAVTLNATVNPLGISASGYFEYVEEATYQRDIAELGPEHGFDHAAKAPDPAEPIEFESGESLKLGSAQISGLKPSTSYRFRIVATDVKIKPKEIAGPTVSFRTFGGGALPDGRAWELVSPGLKNNAEVAVPGNAAGFVEPRSIRIQAAAGSGEAVTYTSFTSFGQAESAPATSQYLSKRTASGWVTDNVSPFGFLSLPIFPPYNGFTPDLKFGVFKVTEPPLTPDCRKGSEDMYLRDNETGELHCLSPEVAGGPESPCLVYGGASADGSRAFLAGRPSGGELLTYSLYEWTAAGGPQLLSVFPNGEPAPATFGTLFGGLSSRGGFGSGIENCQVTRTPLRNAISKDGSRAFWTYVPEDSKQPIQLFVRVDGSKTVQLDALPKAGEGKPGAGPAGNGIFRAASVDGSVAFFTDTGRLVSGSKANQGIGGEDPGEPDLYRYELGKAEPLSDLTKGAVTANVLGVIGASDDGAYVYFVAKGALSGAEENAAGQKASEGANNLYLNHEGKNTFIATLSGEDAGDWAKNPRDLRARVSPDGKHLAFLSTQAKALADYDNTIAAGEHCRYELTIESEFKLVGGPLCAQAFLYDTETKALSCASCNPSGSRPLGPTVLPGWSNGFEGPRYLSDDGSRLFFQSYDALSAADENGKGDVYEFERPGSGSCRADSPAFDPISGGCHFLISSGQGEDETFLIDASADGRDVFFSTRSQLTGWDVNQNFDVYDARAGGGFPEPAPAAPPCQGEGCKPPPLSPPAVSAPARFEGPGNQAGKAKKKHKAKKHRKKSSKHKAKKKQSRANHKQGARR